MTDTRLDDSNYDEGAGPHPGESRRQLRRQVVEAHDEIRASEARNAALKAKIARLEAERDVYVPLDSGGTGSAGAEWARREQVREAFDAAPRSVVPASAERVRAAAVAYRAAQRAIDDDPEAVPDDDPRWEAFMAASDSFTNAVGFGFSCEAEDVADLLIAVLPEHPSAERVANDDEPAGVGTLQGVIDATRPSAERDDTIAFANADEAVAYLGSEWVKAQAERVAALEAVAEAAQGVVIAPHTHEGMNGATCVNRLAAALAYLATLDEHA